LWPRVASTPDYSLKTLYVLRSFAFQGILGKLRRTLERFRNDAEFRHFHEGRTTRLPAFYRHLHARRLGRYAQLISAADMTHELEGRRPLEARTRRGARTPRAPSQWDAGAAALGS